MKRIIAVFGFCLVIGLAGCSSTSTTNTATAVAPVGPTFVEDVKCGNSFPLPRWWPSGEEFAYEVLDKGSSNFKVKTLANVNGQVIHLGCGKVASLSEVTTWLIDEGYGITSDESVVDGGMYATVGKGAIYSIPSRLYN